MADVLVAMSGGVDSSVAAALMIEAGHRVTGVTLKLWSGPAGEAPTQGCCTASDALDARRVADALGIPYYVFNEEEEFATAVVAPFAAAYREGLTPNPCVECNRHLKFSLLVQRAMALGMDAVATGHHVRLRHGRLFRAVDAAKDQSYVLHMLTAPVLARCLFPVGEMTKAEVRERAAALGLRTAAKPESQDACFIGAGGLAAVTGRTSRAVVDAAGRLLGETAAPVTVGQRKGIGLAAGRRLFVTDVDAHRVVMGDAGDLWRRRFEVGQVSFVSGRRPAGTVGVQVRYRGEPAPGRLLGDIVELDEPVRAPAPGQSAVFYDGDEMLGGGVITRVLR